MPQKVTDIFYTRKVQKVFGEKPVVIPKKIEQQIPPVKPKSPIRKGFLIILLILVVGALTYYRLLKVEIKIWPKSDIVSFRTKLTLDANTGNYDFENQIIPGKIFEAEKVFSEEFPSSGKISKKAEGVIRLYNAFSINPETWLAGTRFVSSEGKLFKSKDKISVPGAGMSNGKITPSSVDVPVVAAEGGEDYNIDPSHFSIVAFRGTLRYSKFYGESFQQMTGGGEFSQVTKDDLQKAENTLIEKAKKEIKEIVRNTIPNDFVFLEDAEKIEILDNSSPVKEGAEVEKFSFQVKAKSTTISFKKEEGENFAKNFIFSQISEGKLLYSDSLKINYSPELTDFESGKVSLSLDLSAEIYPEIDLESLKKELVGKSLNGAESFLKNQTWINRVEIRAFPFLLKGIPNDVEKIKIQYPIID